MHKYILTIIFLLYAQYSFSQTNLPLVKASGRVVSIRDGLHFMKGYWYIMPEKKPDRYFVELPGKEQKVTFITDLDSISFNISYGNHYDFIILLNNKDSCYTRIEARYKQIISYKSQDSSNSRDTIPFTIGDNSKIYFKARLNNSEPLDVQFDLGAGGSGIKKASVNKVKMNFDDSLTLHNSDGSNVVPSSSTNKLNIAGLTWDNIQFAVADNYTHREDLIVGNYLFQNKVVEINYDKKIVIIHDTLPALASGYTKHEMFLSGGAIPFLQGSVSIGSSENNGWFMFDTGAYTTKLSTNQASAADKSFIELMKMGGIKSKAAAMSPKLFIGNHEFSGFNYTVEKSGSDETRLGLLGNDLLKRFNAIIDNRNGHIYLHPNSLVDDRYDNPEYYLVRIAVAVFIFIAGSIVFVIYRKKHRRKLRN
jgi:hypothetical protein